MNEALGWIGQIVEWFGQFIPRWTIIKTTHAGVKFARGWKVSALAPGIHWYWPATTEMVIYPVARQANDLRSQTLETSEGTTVVASAVIVYEVNDVEALIAHTYDADNTIAEIALSTVQDVLTQLTWDQASSMKRRVLNTMLKNSSQKVLKPYGVTVLNMNLTDLARCQVLKVLTDSQTPQIVLPTPEP